MKLDEFITQVLVDLNKGVLKAATELNKEDTVGCINPIFKEGGGSWQDYVQDVDFDIAITVSDKLSGKAGADIKVISLGGSAEHENGSISRVKFTVPVIHPGVPKNHKL